MLFSEIFNDVFYWQQIAASLLCAAIIGGHRQWQGRAPGIRTSLLVALGCMEFTRLGALANAAAGHDRLRVVGQIVVGIGFLGGGLILHQDGRVRGITAAVRIWFLAGVASAIGLGEFSLGISIAVVTTLIMDLLARLERRSIQLQPVTHQESPQEK